MALFRLRETAALLLLVSHAAAWSVTQYIVTSTSVWPGESTASTLSTTVTPTGPVNPIASNTTTLTYDSASLSNYIAAEGTYIVTLTNLYLAPDASACATSLDNVSFTCMPSTSSTGTPTITTRIFAPLVIANPSSCTKTTFSYTSSTIIYLEELPFSTALQAQAPDSAEAVFVTTYVVTLSTDLGGQAVTTTYADVYLNSDAVLGLTPTGPIASYLSQCIDPSSAVCSSSVTVTEILGCTLGPITYPPTGPSGGSGGSGATAASSSSSPATTSKNGVEGAAGLIHAKVVLGVAGLMAAFLL